jgi:hypothetical protein
MENELTEFVCENNKLYTDESSAKIKYIARITDPTLYSPAFITAFAARLAYEICFPLTNNANLTKVKYEEYLEKLESAKGLDAQSGGTPEKVDDDEEFSWINERG